MQVRKQHLELDMEQHVVLEKTLESPLDCKESQLVLLLLLLLLSHFSRV